MAIFLGPATDERQAEPFARPVRMRGPQGPWDQVREAVERHGSVVVHARLDDWLPADLDDPGLRPLLGRDHARFRAMTHPQVRSRFVASRLLLKHVACAVIEAAPETVELAYKPGGRPYLRGLDQIDISLSHTENLLLVGLTRRGWIGVDAEAKDRPMLGLGTENQVCTPYERRTLAQIAEERRNAALVRLWTLKEAYSKAIGQGMRFRFTEFGFGPQDRDVQVLRPDGSPGTGEEWTFHTCLVDRAYTVSVALFDAGFGDTADTAAATMLDAGLIAALADDPHETGGPHAADGRHGTTRTAGATRTGDARRTDDARGAGRTAGAAGADAAREADDPQRIDGPCGANGSHGGAGAGGSHGSHRTDRAAGAAGTGRADGSRGTPGGLGATGGSAGTGGSDVPGAGGVGTGGAWAGREQGEGGGRAG
ncbi:4'-phosphopantetheinyl transferase superfamily protein [Streptomyces albus]|uniref:4'-phosphopantetheinyl transferase superfamily protein n=1 Tax=Streptomyces albus TaxID=1888 RepID=UPI00340392E9